MNGYRPLAIKLLELTIGQLENGHGHNTIGLLSILKVQTNLLKASKFFLVRWTSNSDL